MSAKKIQSTKNYRLFVRHTDDNRPLDIKKHKRLLESMKLYGFLEGFPIVCFRDKDGNLNVKDGQHRLLIAEMLGLPVHWVEEKVDFDPSITSTAARPWSLRDYAEKFAANGQKDYQEGLDFAEQHGLPLGIAFSLLAGYTGYSHVAEAYTGGTYKVKDRAWADAVAGVYGPMVTMSAELKGARFIEACMAICRVKDFDAKRLFEGAKRLRNRLVNLPTRDAYLDLAEEVYNFGRKQLVGLKTAALMAMKERNAIEVKKKARALASNGKAH